MCSHQPETRDQKLETDPMNYRILGIDLEQWRQRPVFKQYVESAAALLSPLL